jgi:peptide methionine sulfoxide reductase MsrA
MRARMSDSAETAILAGGCFWGVHRPRGRWGQVSRRSDPSGLADGEGNHRDHVLLCPMQPLAVVPHDHLLGLLFDD